MQKIMLKTIWKEENLKYEPIKLFHFTIEKTEAQCQKAGQWQSKKHGKSYSLEGIPLWTPMLILAAHTGMHRDSCACKIAAVYKW